MDFVSETNKKNLSLKNSYPREGDIIKVKLDKNINEWLTVRVGKSAYKAGVRRRKNKDYVNVRYEDGKVGGIALDQVDWEFKT